MDSTKKKKKQFILFRLLYGLVKKIFYTGLVNILPTILVISILVIAYNFLYTNLGAPLNALIKRQLATRWQSFAVTYLEIDPELYEPIKTETYEQLVKRVQNSSLSFHEAKQQLEEARKKFHAEATPLIQKKESTDDRDYMRFLDQKIQKIRESSGLNEAERIYQQENIRLRKEIERENEIRLTRRKWGDTRAQKLRDEINEKYPDIIGLLLAFVIIFLVGVLITTFAGRTLKHLWERAVSSLPLVRKLYPYTKQLTEFLFEEKKTSEFRSVALVEYPRKGIFALGFPTGEIRLHTSPDAVKKITMFIPSSPTPFTGYTIIVDESELTPLHITVEEAIRFCITGGVVKPDFFRNIPLPEPDNPGEEKDHA